MILKKIFRFEIFCGICKIFLDCPFSASVFFLMVVTNVLLIIITLLPVCVKSNQPTVMQAIKRKRDVAEDSDEEGNVCCEKISSLIVVSGNVISVRKAEKDDQL